MLHLLKCALAVYFVLGLLPRSVQSSFLFIIEYYILYFLAPIDSLLSPTPTVS